MFLWYNFGDAWPMPSSVIKQMNYNSKSHILRIIYVSGHIYDYNGVPGHVFNEMKKASSKGEFLNRVIKKNYPFKKVA